MRIRLLLLAVTATLLIGGIVPVYADTIAARLPGTVGNNWSLYAGQFLVSSWTQGSATNESISTYLDGGGTFGFQLSTAIGPTATASNSIASITLDISQSSLDWLQVFSGLNLAANTYYLTAYGIDNASGSWPQLISPTEVGALGGEFFASNSAGGLNSSDPFRSTMYSVSLSMGLKIEGDSSTVPEPTSILLLCTGLGGLALAGWRKRRA